MLFDRYMGGSRSRTWSHRQRPVDDVPSPWAECRLAFGTSDLVGRATHGTTHRPSRRQHIVTNAAATADAGRRATHGATHRPSCRRHIVTDATATADAGRRA